MRAKYLYDQDLNVESVDVLDDTGITHSIPVAKYQQACEIAYNEDSFQVIGKDESHDWIIRDYEDPQSDTLQPRFVVGSSGFRDFEVEE